MYLLRVSLAHFIVLGYFYAPLTARKTCFAGFFLSKFASQSTRLINIFTNIPVYENKYVRDLLYNQELVGDGVVRS